MFLCFCEKESELGMLLCEYSRCFQNSTFYDEVLYHMALISEKCDNENLPLCDVI